MRLPLYTNHNAPRQYNADMHVGLWFDKFCNQWCSQIANTATPQPKHWSLASFIDHGQTINPKQDWLNTVNTKRVGDRVMLEEWATRQQSLVERCGGQGFVGTTVSRFVTGMGRNHPVENGFTFHPVLGVPYLPGTGSKGICKTWFTLCQEMTAQAKQRGSQEVSEPWVSVTEHDIDRIFGTGDQCGTVVFLDACPTKPVRLEIDVMTPHVGPYYQGENEPPADWHSPIPIPYLTAAAGASFFFGVLPRNPRDAGNKKDVALVAQQLQQALGWIGAGAKTAAGYGRFHVG